MNLKKTHSFILLLACTQVIHSCNIDRVPLGNIDIDTIPTPTVDINDSCNGVLAYSPDGSTVVVKRYKQSTQTWESSTFSLATQFLIAKIDNNNKIILISLNNDVISVVIFDENFAKTGPSTIGGPFTDVPPSGVRLAYANNDMALLMVLDQIDPQMPHSFFTSDCGANWEERALMGAEATNIDFSITLINNLTFLGINKTNGDGLFVWSKDNKIFSEKFDSGSESWESPVEVASNSTIGTIFQSPAISMNTSGNALIGWSESNYFGGFDSILNLFSAYTRNVGTTWQISSPSPLVSSTFASGGQVLPALNNDDKGLVVAINQFEKNGPVKAFGFTFDGAVPVWTNEQEIISLSDPTFREFIPSRGPIIGLCNDMSNNGILPFSIPATSNPNFNFNGVAIYNGTTAQWSVPAAFDPNNLKNRLSLACTVAKDKSFILANKLKRKDGRAEIATVICCESIAPFIINAPTNATGLCCLNRFPMQGELFTRLNWTPSTSSNVVSQEITRNQVFVTSLATNITSFEEHNLPKGAKTYSIFAVNNFGLSNEADVEVNC